MNMSRTIEQIGLTMLRWGSKRPVLLQRPPSWTVQYLSPAACGQATNQRGTYWSRWHLANERANPLSYVNANGSAIKVTLP